MTTYVLLHQTNQRTKVYPFQYAPSPENPNPDPVEIANALELDTSEDAFDSLMICTYDGDIPIVQGSDVRRSVRDQLTIPF